jgi:RND family efflux transporter MFP subunit
MSSFFPRGFARRRLGLALLALLSVAVTWLWAHEGHQALPSRGVGVDAEQGVITLSSEVYQALGVQTAEVATRMVAETIRAPARVVSPWTSHAFVTTRIAGKVAHLHVRPGEAVQKGQALAEVESLELETLQFEYRSALEDLRLAEENLRPLEEANKNGDVSNQVVYEARSRQRELLNAVTLSGRKLLLLGLESATLDTLRSPSARPVRRLSVRSPLSGILVHADVHPGQVVEPTQHLFEVVDPFTLWIEVDILENDLRRMQVGQPLVVHWPGSGRDVSRSVVEGIGKALQAETHTGVVWATVRPPSNLRLLPGLQGEAEVLLSGVQAAPAVPASAILYEGVERVVFVQIAPRQFERKSVVLGREKDGWVEIVGGAVYPGDLVMTTGSHELATLLPRTVLRLSPEGLRQSGVQVEPVSPHSLDQTLTMTGSVELPPAHRAIVGAPLTGTVQRIFVQRDQALRKGEPIAEVASLEFQSLQLELLRSHLQLGLLEQTLQPLRSLSASGNPALSARHLREVESNTRATRLKRESLLAKLRTVGFSEELERNLFERQQIVDTLVLRAPIDGTLVRFLGVLGQVIKTEEPLFELHDLSHREIRAQVAERDRDRVHPGQRARLRLTDSDRVLEGRVTRTEPVIGPGDRSLAVWIEVKDLPAGIPPGALARITLVTAESSPILAVAREAVLSDNRRRFVFVRQRDGRFERRPIEVGPNDDRYVAVSHGLAEGEMVAVQGAMALQTGYLGLK